MSTLRTKKVHIIFFSLILVFVVILSTEARATLYGFEAITPTNSPYAGVMAAQLSLEVNPYGSNQVEFIFKNNIAPYAVVPGEGGVITEVAFEDGMLFAMGSPYMVSGSAVNFVEDTSPPGGTWGLGFDTTQFFRADATSPSPTNGVNPYESLGIVFDLQTGKAFSDVIAALNQGFTGPIVSGESLRIGIHVQNLDPDGDYSDAFILTPVPGAFLLGMLGLGVAGVKLRRFA